MIDIASTPPPATTLEIGIHIISVAVLGTILAIATWLKVPSDRK